MGATARTRIIARMFEGGVVEGGGKKGVKRGCAEFLPRRLRVEGRYISWWMLMGYRGL